LPFDLERRGEPAAWDDRSMRKADKSASFVAINKRKGTGNFAFFKTN
jgi:hypothetical protein